MDSNPLFGMMGDSDESDESSYNEEDDFSGEEEAVVGGGDGSDSDDPMAIKSSKKDRKSGGGKLDSRKVRKMETLLDRANVKVNMQKDIITRYEDHMNDLEQALAGATKTLADNESMIDILQQELKHSKNQITQASEDSTLKALGGEARGRIASFQAAIAIEANAEATIKKRVNKTSRSKASCDGELPTLQQLHKLEHTKIEVDADDGGGGGGGAKENYEAKIEQARDEMQKAFNQQLAKMKSDMEESALTKQTTDAHDKEQLTHEMEKLSEELAHLKVAFMVSKQKTARARKRRGVMVKAPVAEGTEEKAPNKKLKLRKKEGRGKKKEANATLTKQWANMLHRTQRASVVMTSYRNLAGNGNNLVALRMEQITKEVNDLTTQFAVASFTEKATISKTLKGLNKQLADLSSAHSDLDVGPRESDANHAARFSGFPEPIVE